MITVNINDASAQLPRLFEQAKAGESIVLCQGNVPVVEMKPASPAQPSEGERVLGNPPFPMTFPEDAFDPLPEKIWNMFNGYDDENGL